jgi:hypothetical protein
MNFRNEFGDLAIGGVIVLSFAVIWYKLCEALAQNPLIGQHIVKLEWLSILIGILGIAMVALGLLGMFKDILN